MSVSVKDVSAGLKATINNYSDSLKAYSEAEFYFKKTEDIWSLAQMYEHILYTGQGFFKERLKACLAHNGEIGGEPNESGKFILQLNGFPPKKYKRPDTEAMPMVKGKELAYYKAEFPKMLQDFLDLEPAVAVDKGEYRKKHFYFGMLNAKEWFQNFEIHLRHHLRQKAELESYLKYVKPI